MTLDDRIEKDLKELYDTGEIRGAIDLDGLVKTDKSKYCELVKLADTPEKQKTLQRYMMDQTSFATRALPVYDGGKRDAKTVMVMLLLDSVPTIFTLQIVMPWEQIWFIMLH